MISGLIAAFSWKMVAYVAVLAGSWAYIIRLSRKLDSGAFDYAQACEKLRQATAEKLALKAQINDANSRALTENNNAMAAQVNAKNLQAYYESKARDALQAPVTDAGAVDFLRSEAGK